MFIRLSLHLILSILHLRSTIEQDLFYSCRDILYRGDKQTFSRGVVGRGVRAERHAWVEALVYIERRHVSYSSDIVVISDFCHGDPLCPVVLHVVTIHSQALLDILISPL